MIIDGSYGEGGGQILRTALALAVLTGRTVTIERIRANRPNPGLAPQHLAVVHALAEICAGDVTGARVGAQSLTFTPQTRPLGGAYIWDVAQLAGRGSAGAVTLLFQAVLPALLFAGEESRLTLRGGTHVAWSPPFDYLENVYLPTLNQMGVHVEIQLDAWGFYPRGGGQATAWVRPVDPPLRSLDLVDRGHLEAVTGRAVACNLPAHIAQRMANRAQNVLRENRVPADIAPQRVSGVGPGAGIFLTARYAQIVAGFSALGERGKPSEQVADEACQALLAHHADDAAVDPHLADQILLPMALAQGSSQFTTSRITNHLLTNAYVIGQFLPGAVHVEGNPGEAGAVTVVGQGFQPIS